MSDLFRNSDEVVMGKVKEFMPNQRKESAEYLVKEIDGLLSTYGIDIETLHKICAILTWRQKK